MRPLGRCRQMGCSVLDEGKVSFAADSFRGSETLSHFSLSYDDKTPIVPYMYVEGGHSYSDDALMMESERVGRILKCASIASPLESCHATEDHYTGDDFKR